MLQFTFVLFQRFQLPILMGVGIAGFICCCVADHLAKKNQKTPGSVKRCREITISLYIAGFILMVSAMLTMYILGYYNEFLPRFLQR